MAKLKIDENSIRSLNHLDNLQKNDNEKFIEIVKSTSGKPLERLLIASIARQNFMGKPDDSNLLDISRLLELLIYNNLLSTDSDNNEADVQEVIEAAGEKIQHELLILSVSRYVILNQF